MRTIIFFLLFLAAAPAAAQDPPRDPEHGPVLAAVEALFAAMLAHDAAAIAAIVEPQGLVTAVTSDAGGDTMVNTRSWADFAAGLAQGHSIRERMFAPEVRVRGDLAMVWARYDLFIDGNFSHCGTDLFELVRRQGRWRLLHASFTRERAGCEQR